MAPGAVLRPLPHSRSHGFQHGLYVSRQPHVYLQPTFLLVFLIPTSGPKLSLFGPEVCIRKTSSQSSSLHQQQLFFQSWSLFPFLFLLYPTIESFFYSPLKNISRIRPLLSTSSTAPWPDSSLSLLDHYLGLHSAQ